MFQAFNVKNLGDVDVAFYNPQGAKIKPTNVWRIINQYLNCAFFYLEIVCTPKETELAAAVEGNLVYTSTVHNLKM